MLRDINFILKKIYESQRIEIGDKISSPFIREQRHVIRKYFSYNICTDNFKSEVKSHLRYLLGLNPKHHDVFRELFVFMDSRNIIIPSYRVFQNMFADATASANERLKKQINIVPKALSEQLDNMIANHNGIGSLSIMKQDQKDFKFTALRKEVKKANQIKELYLYSSIPENCNYV